MSEVHAVRDDILAAIDSQTLCDLFQSAVATYPDADALVWDDGGNWRSLTWAEYGDRVKRAAMGLSALGVDKGDFVAIMATNRPEHLIADLAAVHIGATPVSVYNTLSPEQIAHVAGNCGAKVAVLNDPEHLERWASVKDRLPELQTGVLLDGSADADWAISWDELLTRGGQHLAEAGEDAYRQRWEAVEPDDPVTLIYTSGTTGPPKGVIETHKGVLFILESVRRFLELPTNLSMLSYLPLAHVAERTFSHYQGIKYAAKIHFCDDLNKVAEALPVARPYAFLAVPRVWEKMRSALLAKVKEAEGPKRKLADQAFSVVPQLGAVRLAGRTPSLLLAGQAALFDKLVYAKVRAALGLDQCRVAVTGAAPMPDDLIIFFKGLGIEILNVYGMTETTAVTNANRPGQVRLGTVGPALPGVEVATASDGEVIARGPSMTPGYWKQEDATKELFDDDGWLHTGDLGEIDDDGYLKIVGRKKELIITAGGKNISPTNIEALVSQHPLVGQICVVGDDRKFVSALIVLDPEAAPQWAAEHDVPFESLAAFSKRQEVIAALQQAVDEANSRLARVEQIKRFEVLSEDWTVETGEMTPSLKLKRHVVHQKYGDLIDSMYADA